MRWTSTSCGLWTPQARQARHKKTWWIAVNCCKFQIVYRCLQSNSKLLDWHRSRWWWFEALEWLAKIVFLFLRVDAAFHCRASCRHIRRNLRIIAPGTGMVWLEHARWFAQCNAKSQILFSDQLSLKWAVKRAKGAAPLRLCHRLERIRCQLIRFQTVMNWRLGAPFQIPPKLSCSVL